MLAAVPDRAAVRLGIASLLLRPVTVVDQYAVASRSMIGRCREQHKALTGWFLCSNGITLPALPFRPFSFRIKRRYYSRSACSLQQLLLPSSRPKPSVSARASSQQTMIYDVTSQLFRSFLAVGGGGSHVGGAK